MNFLAHYILATRCLSPTSPRPDYILGNALPDLLPLAAPRSRLRPNLLSQVPITTAEEHAVRAGVLAHLATDTAFHKTSAFAMAQTEIKALVYAAGFMGMRVRGFFLSHLLVEMALDAALLRAEPTLADQFYDEIREADPLAVTRWTEAAVAAPLPRLPQMLARFQQSRYLGHYAEDSGVAVGINRICERARQDTFEGDNAPRLLAVITQARTILQEQASELLTETTASLVL